MPIYEYRCSSCGEQQEVMQKISAPLLTTCAKCGKPTLVKMLTAAGFQLKGSGWYATDFKGKGASAPKETTASGDKAVDGGEKKAAGSAENKTSDGGEKKTSDGGGKAAKAASGTGTGTA